MLRKDEILKLLVQNEYAEFFDALDSYDLDTPEYNRLKKEFVGGKTDIDYNNRCKVLANDFFREKEKKDWQEVEANPTKAILLYFLDIYPKGKYKLEAEQMLGNFKQHQKDANEWFTKGLETGNYELKINFFTKAIELGYEPLQYAYLNRGIAKCELQDYNGSIQDYNQAITLYPNFVVAHNLRGIAKYNSLDYKGALQDFEQAIYLKPDFPSPYHNRGNAKCALQDYKEAIKDYDKAISLQSDNPMYYNNRGHAHYSSGNYEAAIVDWEKMQEVNTIDYKPMYDYIDDARKKAK
jgi:tetratricopeptide (TPR) repeat protein